MDPRIDSLQKRLGHRFEQPQLLERALTHRSFGSDHNERLEFLGDAVLSLAISGLLYERFSGSDEGDLTRVRAHLVREDSLHRTALQLGLPEGLRLSEGEARAGGGLRPSITPPASSRPPLALRAVVGGPGAVGVSEFSRIAFQSFHCNPRTGADRESSLRALYFRGGSRRIPPTR